MIGAAALASIPGLLAQAAPRHKGMLWDFPLFPEQASAGARQVDILFFSLIGASLIVTIGIAAAMLYFAIKYRAGSKASRAGEVKNTLPFELTWISIPAVIFLFLFLWAARIYFRMADPPPDALEVYIVGQ